VNDTLIWRGRMERSDIRGTNQRQIFKRILWRVPAGVRVGKANTPVHCGLPTQLCHRPEEHLFGVPTSPPLCRTPAFLLEFSPPVDLPNCPI